MFLFIFFACWFGLLGLILINHGLDVHPPAVAIASAFLVLYSLAVASMVSLLFPAAFSADGVFAHSSWGMRRFVSWKEITAARPFRVLNLRWLRLYTTRSRKVTWLPLFQAHKTEFQQEIQRFAPPGSPLLSQLR
jgi:hypothetical protein